MSNFGRVRSLNYGHTNKSRLLTPSKNFHGYLRVALSKNGKTKLYTIHRLVAIEFLENINNLPQINHKDENKENNNVSNLEWCDCKYNINYRNGISRRASTVLIEQNGIKHTISEWSEITGISRTTIDNRRYRKCSIEKILEKRDLRCHV